MTTRESRTDGHTAGPWKREDRTARGEGYSIIATDVHYSQAGVAHYISERDVPVIEAAPEMLAALKRLLALCEAGGDPYEEPNHPVVKQALLAISKAEGTQP